MTVRASAFLLTGVFVIALAVQVANRLSNDALNFAIGAVCGMAVSIPVSFGLLLAVYRRQVPQEEDEVIEPAPQPVTHVPEALSPAFAGAAFNNSKPPYPQIIVVSPNPSQFQNTFGPYPDYYRPNLNAGPEQGLQERTWKIVGEEEE